MITFLFWNVGRHDRTDLICQLCNERSIDVLALTESACEASDLLKSLQTRVSKSYFSPESTTPKLQLFGSDKEIDLREVLGNANGRMTIRSLKTSHGEFLLAVVHLVDKRNWSERSQALEATVLANDIRRMEDEIGHRRTVLFGDLNMNPFEDGVVGAQCFHAMMDRQVALDRERTVQGNTYPFFYNPMWGLFGDNTQGPSGTFYYRNSESISYDWNMLDQVLIRPDALEHFEGIVKIITTVGSNQLIRPNGRPDSSIGSDHLPLLFELNVNRGSPCQL